MTLIVSLRIPDGIVIAGDSLTTLVGQQIEAQSDVVCPHCKQTTSSHTTISPVITTDYFHRKHRRLVPFAIDSVLELLD